MALAYPRSNPSHYVADEETFLEETRKLEIITQTFIQYQKDGTWKEVCGERQFVSNGQHTVMSGLYIPIAERPDP
jgi:hypothetical protein